MLRENIRTMQADNEETMAQIKQDAAAEIR